MFFSSHDFGCDFMFADSVIYSAALTDWLALLLISDDLKGDFVELLLAKFPW